MPAYELSLAIRTMTKPELAATLKRTALAIFDRDGIIRSIDNLGFRNTPYKMNAHGINHKEANFFIFKFDTPTVAIADLNEEFGRDVDIIRRRLYKVEKEEQPECTLHEETLPPAYRLDVKALIAKGKKQDNPFTQVFKYNSGLDYYPFQK